MSAKPRTLRGLVLAGAAAAALLFAGCSGIPQSGPVQLAHQQSAPDDLDVILLPNGPTPGASQEDILNGFVRAGASPQNDYAVARQFLSQSFAHAWDPNQSTTVDTGDRVSQRSGETAVELLVTPIAQVDSGGEYSENASQTALTLSYVFVTENGEWRIAAAPDGILLEQFRFDQVFSAQAIYFFDPTFTYLVPDLRWFPRLAATGTRIVRALLAGPAPWLQGAVVSAFPAGTSTTAVVTQSGQANVDLSPDVLNADAVSKRRMADQLRMSLSSLSGVSTVQLTVNQSPLAIPETGLGPPVVDPHVDARTLVLKDGVFGYLTGDQVASIPDISDRVQVLAPTAVMYAAALRTAAVLGAGGVSAVRGGSESVLLDGRSGLIPPAVDTRGFVWSVPRDAPGQLLAFGPDGTASAVATNWEGATGISSLEVSRDGTRLLALVSIGGQASLVAAGIIRDQSGAPQRLGAPLNLATAPGVGVGATWVDDNEVASLIASGSEVRVTVQELGGRRRPLGAVTSGMAIAGGNDLDGLRVRDATGQLQQPRGSGWQLTGVSVTVLGKQY